MTEKKSEKERMPLKKILGNNLFMLGLIHKVDPLLVPLTLINAVLEAVLGLISHTALLRCTLNGISGGKSFKEIAGVILFWIIINTVIFTLNCIYYIFYYSIRMTEVKKQIHTVAYKKAAAVKLGCYENPKYYDRFAKAIDECANRAGRVLATIEFLLHRLIRFSANSIMIIFIDPVLLLSVLSMSYTDSGKIKPS